MTNFFIGMRHVEDRFLERKSENSFSSDSKSSFFSLVRFVEAAGFTNSKSFQFICRNWRLSSVELASLWKSQGYGTKSSNTFRAQVFNLSSILKTMFSVSSLEDVYLAKDMDKISFIDDVVNAVSMQSDGNEVTFDSLFLRDVVDYIGKVYVDESDYVPSECELELSVLKGLKSERVEELLDETDVTKLAYIKQILNKPVVCKGNTVNVAKVELLRSLKLLKRVTLSQLKKENIPQENIQGNIADDNISLATELVEDVFEHHISDDYSVLAIDDLLTKLEIRSGEQAVGELQSYSKVLRMVSLLLNPATCDKVISELKPEDAKVFLESLKK